MIAVFCLCLCVSVRGDLEHIIHTATIVFIHYYGIATLATVGMLNALEALFQLVAICIELINRWPCKKIKQLVKKFIVK